MLQSLSTCTVRTERFVQFALLQSFPNIIVMCAIYEYLKYACVANCGVVLNCEGPVELASFPGLPQLQFLIACSMQKLLAPFLLTASDQKLEPGKAWERGYCRAA